MNILQRIIPAVALFSAAPFAPAQALSNATAELTSVKVQVIDMTPDDGIAASLTIAPGGHVFTALQTDARWLTDPSPLYIDQRLQFDTFPSAPPEGDGAVILGLGPVGGTATRVGNGLFASTNGGEGLATQAYSWWETAKTTSQALDGTPQLTGSFVLGAGSAVTLTADYHVFASIAAGYGGAVIATSGLFGFVGTVVMGDLQQQLGTASIAAPGEQTFSGTLTLTLSNPSNIALPVYFGAQASTYTEAPSPVPEPGTVLLMLAGSLLVGWRARRGR